MASFFDLFNFRGRPPEETASLKLSSSEQATLSDELGVKLAQDANGKLYILPDSAPAGVNSTDGFIKYWMETGFIDPFDADQTERDRLARYQHYEFMDANSSESALALDTYTDELISAGLIDDNPVDISISDKKAQEDVLKVLENNQIITDAKAPAFERGEIRQLAKYGDRFYKMTRTSNTVDGIGILKIKHPHLVRIKFDPITYKTLAYEVANGDNYYPWEFVHMRIPDNRFNPYGRSVLEGMRSAYLQLLINESLLSLSRASRVERLVVRVPTTSKNPTSAFASLQNVRSQWKSVIFGNSGSAQSKTNVNALTNILWMPSGEEYSIDQIRSNIDVSGIDDVEYFRDKFLMASRLPKGYLLADDTQRVEEGSLQAQDLKFARALLPLQYGYVEGLTRLCTMVLILLGYDPDKVEVTVKVSKPQAISSQIISDAGDSIALLDTLMQAYGRAIGADGDEVKDIKTLTSLIKDLTGVPENILKRLEGLYEKAPEGTETKPTGGLGDPAEIDAMAAQLDNEPKGERLDLLNRKVVCTSGMILASTGQTKEQFMEYVTEHADHIHGKKIQEDGTEVHQEWKVFDEAKVWDKEKKKLGRAAMMS